MPTPDWHTPEFPELRDGPPWVMQEMMAAQSGLAEAVLGAQDPAAAAVAGAVGEALGAGETVTVTGCGTSEHGAHGIAAQLAAAVPAARRGTVRALPALTAAFEPTPGLCLAVSHDGGTRATLLALEAARAAGARTAAITHKPDGSVAGAAEHVLVTPVGDRSWCHTVGYTSALLAGAAVARQLGGSGGAGPGAGARGLLAGALAAAGAEGAAGALADRRVVLCAGAGVDQVTVRELALKLAEGARLPTLGLELETVLHGQLAGHDGADALVVVALAGPADAERVARRLEHVTAAAAALGMPVAGLLSPWHAERLDPEQTPAGRLVAPAPATELAPTAAALLAGAALLQALTLALAHARGCNPDLIRREEAPYRAAAAAAEGADGW